MALLNEDMKYLVYLLFPLIFIVNGRLSAQNNNEATIKKALQGLWQLSTRHNITLAISGDTLVEYDLDNFEMGIYKCKLYEKPCDNEEFIKSPLGIYFNIENGDADALCAAMMAITDKYFKLQLDKETMIQFEKLL